MAVENASVNSTAQQLHAFYAATLQKSGSSFLANLTQHQFLSFVTIVIIGFFVSYVFVFLCKTVIKAITLRTETDLDDILLQKLQHPVALSLFFLSLNVALVPLSLGNKLASFLSTFIMSANILLLGVIVNRTLATIVLHVGQKITEKTETTVDDQLLPIIRRMLTATVYAVALLFMLGAWGVNVAPLIAGAGIAGIAIAFALQESLKNVFGGVSLAFDHAYAIGDRIKLTDGTIGVVYDISLRSTKIRTFTGDLITVPNGKIANESFQSYAQPTAETVVNLPFSIAYGSDPEKCKKLISEAIKGIPHMIEKNPEKAVSVDFVEMGPFSLNMRVWFWVDDYRESWNAKLEANKRIYNTLVKNKIEIPYPTQAIVLKK